MKKLLTLVLALAMSVPALAHAPKSLNATHRIEMHSLVVDPDTGKAPGGICSATAIGPHALLTAKHCDFPGQSIIKIDGQDFLITKRIVDGYDHEIFIVDAHFAYTADFEHADALQKGDDVWMEGNAAALNQLVRRGVFSGIIMLDGKVIEAYDYNGYFGDSGSAIFDEHGKIVAVTSVGVFLPGWHVMGAYPLHFTPEQLQEAQQD